MKKLILGAAVIALALAPLAGFAAEKKAAKAKPAAGKAVKAEALPAGALLVDNFETPGAKSKLNTGWFSGCDKNGLGSTISPDPFKPTAGGSPLSPKFCGFIKGHYGKNQAPWPWAQLSIDTKDPKAGSDLSAYKGIQFYAKGDKKNYRVILCRDAVKDFADFEVAFFAGSEWKLVKKGFEDFSQPNWSKAPVKAGWNDVNQIKFAPVYNDLDFELAVDDIALTK
jgi:hypothetical protein